MIYIELINKCCGKGFGEVAKLKKILDKHKVKNLFRSSSFNSKHARNILEKYNITIKNKEFDYIILLNGHLFDVSQLNYIHTSLEGGVLWQKLIQKK